MLQRKDRTTDRSEDMAEMHALTLKIEDEHQANTFYRAPLGLEETASFNHKRWRKDQRVKAAPWGETTAASTTEQ